MRSERRLREGESQIFKLTCIPTLLAAPPPKQYSTTTLIPPATQATGIATEKYKNKSNRICFGWTMLLTSEVSGKQLLQDCGEGG